MTEVETLANKIKDAVSEVYRNKITKSGFVRKKECLIK